MPVTRSKPLATPKIVNSSNKIIDDYRGDTAGSIITKKRPNKLSSGKKRSYSTTVSSKKLGLHHATVTSRINAINIKPKKKDKILLNLKYSQYDIISEVAEELGFKVTKSDKLEYDVIWTDLPTSSNLLSKMQRFQRTNHYPGTSQIANKSCLARNLKKMAKMHPNGYAFFPQSWILPTEIHDLKK